jgi:hypothetical protein
LSQNDIRVQSLYARWLDLGTRVSFAASLVAFVLYMSGVMPTYIPLDKLPRYWGLPVGEFLRQTGAPSGWGWLGNLGHAEYLNLACMALIGLVSLACYARVVPTLLGLGERLQAALAILQVVVLAAAIFAGGG